MIWIQKNSLPLLLGTVMTLNILVGVRQYAAGGEDERAKAYKHLALLTTVIEQVRHHYVDQESTSYADLIQGSIRGMLDTLDPHSQFMDTDMYNDLRDDTQGEFGGLGVVISIKDGVLTVVAPMEDTPGFRAGILPGDKILAINDESTEGVPLQQAVKKLRGEPGSSVTLRLYQVDTGETLEITMVREQIQVESVKDARILDDSGIAYLRVTAFNQRTSDELQIALDQLTRNNMTALIVDLRNNPGGLLSAAIEVSEKFLSRDTMVVYTQGRGSMSRQTYHARSARPPIQVPVAILINGGSASASEIVAGALQDHQRAVLVGERSFGKGSVQSILPLDDGSAIRLTTAKYYTPSERTIHNVGIEPDIVVPLTAEQRMEIHASRTVGAEAARGVNVPPPVDPQIERALDVLRGVLLFSRQANAPSPAGITRSTSP